MSNNWLPALRSNSAAIGPSTGFTSTIGIGTLTADRDVSLPNEDGELQVNPSGSARLPFAGDGAGLAPMFVIKLNIPNDPGPVVVPFAHDVLWLEGDITIDGVGQTLDVTGSTGYSGSVPTDAAGPALAAGGDPGLRAAGSSYSGAASGGGVGGDVYLYIAPRAAS